MTNLLDCEDPTERLRRRALRLSAETGIDAGRLLQWTFAGATLSAVWCLEGTSHALAGALRRLKAAATAAGRTL